MAGLDSSSSSSSSRGNLSPKTKNTALTSNYFSRVRRLALNPISNSAGSTQNFARVLCAVEGTLECWRCSGTKHKGELFYRFFNLAFFVFWETATWLHCARFERRRVADLAGLRTSDAMHVQYALLLRADWASFVWSVMRAPCETRRDEASSTYASDVM
jgi:hypothetical protein